MRRLLVVAAACAVVALLVLGITVSTVMSRMYQAQAQPSSCQATVGPVGDPNGPDGQRQASQLNGDQRAIASQIVHAGQHRQLPQRAWQVAIQAGMTESNLTNIHGGDRDSLGVFQMRPSTGWGSETQITNVDYAVNKFYDVLLGVTGWQEMRPGDAAQSVESSGFPFRYHRSEAMAVVLVGELGGAGRGDPSGCGPTGGAGGGNAPTPAAGTAIQKALSVQGSPYIWGAKGPSTFDCSGLIYWAYQQAGITVPAGSWMQWSAGKRVPVDQAQPGDLVFWAHDPSQPESIHHVALYMGNGQIVQAPDSGKPVQVSGLQSPLTRADELMPMAVRPGT